MAMLDRWYRDKNFSLVQEGLVDQLEDYLKYIKQFSSIETQLKNLVVQRQQTMTHLEQISERYTDLKNFEQ